MFALDTNKTEEIYDKMESIDDDALENSGMYSIKSFSVFDHWLSEEEYCNIDVLYYQEHFDNIESLEKYQKFEERFMSFYMNLYSRTKLYGRFSHSYGPAAIIEFDSIEEYKSHVLMSIRQQLFLRIIVPEYFTVVAGNFDLTHISFTRKTEPESAAIMEKIITDSGLFILP